MTVFSANLGTLFTEHPLLDAVRAAKASGFAAVECHWPFDTDPVDLKAVLDETGLPMLGLNTPRGDVEAGEFGLGAVPGRGLHARAAIDASIDYAVAIGARHIHVLAGLAEGAGARATFIETLRYACRETAPHGLTVLIEPLNPADAPGYFLCSTGQAVEIIAEVDAPNLKLMFDCYHVQLIEGNLTGRLTALMPLIGHIQFAAVPDRGPPTHGELNYRYLFGLLDRLDWTAPIGAEYVPERPTEETLGWMARYR